MTIQLRTGDLARELGISITKVTFYTTYGLFHPSGKTPGGLHLFDLVENRKRYEKIQALKNKHMKLKDIREQLDKT